MSLPRKRTHTIFYSNIICLTSTLNRKKKVSQDRKKAIKRLLRISISIHRQNDNFPIKQNLIQWIRIYRKHYVHCTVCMTYTVKDSENLVFSSLPRFQLCGYINRLKESIKPLGYLSWHNRLLNICWSKTKKKLL